MKSRTRSILRVVAVLCFCHAAMAQAVAPTLPQADIAAIRRQVSRVMAKHRIPAVSVSVQLDDAKWSEASGMADVENSVPAKVESVYRLASVSKLFTATAVMQLVERGKIALEAPIQAYVKAFPEKTYPVTVRELLNHTSGVRHYKSGDETAAEFNNTKHYSSISTAIAQFSADPLQQKPGTGFLYSTHGYTLLGAAVESASGMTFSDYLRENISKPAGLQHTRLDSVADIIPNRVRGYEEGKSGDLRNAPLVDTSNRVPGGGLVSTVEDLVRFAAAVQDGTLVRRETFVRMTTHSKLLDGQQAPVGLGWAMGGIIGREDVVWHGGNQQGATAMLYVLPEKHLTIAILTNKSAQGPAVVQLAGAIADAVLHQRSPAEPH